MVNALIEKTILCIERYVRFQLKHLPLVFFL